MNDSFAQRLQAVSRSHRTSMRGEVITKMTDLLSTPKDMTISEMLAHEEKVKELQQGFDQTQVNFL